MEGSLLNSISEYECQRTKLNDCQKNELIETKRMLEVLKRENEQKSKECQNALNSLQELQNELMRKSMHVGSLGMEVECCFAVFRLVDRYTSNRLISLFSQLLLLRDK